MSDRLYCVHLTRADLDARPRGLGGLSPLERKLRAIFGSTCRLVGSRLMRGNRPTSLCLDPAAVRWQQGWEAGLTVSPALCWLVSRPAVPRPERHRTAIRREQS